MGNHRRTRTLPHQIVERLLAQITAGTFRPGDKLPTELELCRMFNVGRSSVREALQWLVVIGAVDIKPRRGTVVKSIDPASFTLNSALASLLEFETLLELSEMRRILEPEVAALAARRIDDAALEKINESLTGLSQAIEARDREAFILTDIAFHEAIARGSGNYVILSITKEFQQLLRTSRLRTMRAPGALLRTLSGHERIYHALRARDPEVARAAMRTHLEDNRLDLLYPVDETDEVAAEAQSPTDYLGAPLSASPIEPQSSDN